MLHCFTILNVVKKLHKKEKKYIALLMTADTIFLQVHIYDGIKVNLDIYIYIHITKCKLNYQVLRVTSVFDSFSSIIFFICSIFQLFFFFHLLCMQLRRPSLLFNHVFSLFKLDSLLFNQDFSFFDLLDCEHEIEELSALLLRDLGLGPQPRAFE